SPVAGDQAQASPVGKIRISPIDHEYHTVTEANQKEQVHYEPGQPRRESAKFQLPDFCDRPRSADRRHVALIEIMKLRLGGSTAYQSIDVARDVPALLHCYRTNARQRLASLVNVDRGIAYGKRFGVPGNRAIGFDDDASGTVDGHSKSGGERSRANSGCPDNYGC